MPKIQESRKVFSAWQYNFILIDYRYSLNLIRGMMRIIGGFKDCFWRTGDGMLG
jgi:hypothetical protein